METEVIQFQHLLEKNILTFVNESVKHSTTAKTFFDLNFNEIYDVLFTTNISSSSLRSFSESHVKKILSSKQYTISGTGGLFFYIANLLKSLQEYSEKHVLYSTIKTYIETNILTLNIQTGSYFDVINGYYTALNKLTSNISETSLMKDCYFYIAVKYYGGSLTSSNTEKEKAVYFAYLYGTLLKQYSDGLPGEDYSSITKLEQYYNNDYFILFKYNNLMITDFIKKYNSLYANAKTESGLVDGDTIIDINNASIKSTVFDGFSNIEGFSSTVNSNQASLFPTTPTPLNHVKNSYDDNSSRLLEDGFLYEDRNQTYGDLQNYYSSYIPSDKHTYDFESDPFFKCVDTGGKNAKPTIDISFNCGNIAKSYSGQYKNDIFNTVCDSELSRAACNFTRYMALVHKPDGAGSGTVCLTLLTYEKKYITDIVIYTYDNSVFGYDIDDALEKFSTGLSDPKHFFKTNYNDLTDPKNTPEMEMLTYTENKLDLSLNGTEALFSSKHDGTNYVNDNFFKLILAKDDSGVVKPQLQIKPIINKSIADGGKDIGYYSGKVITKGTKDSISLYSIDDPKYKLGNLVNEMGYIGTDGIYYKARGTNVNKTNKMPKLDGGVSDLDLPEKNFKKYTNMVFRIPDDAGSYTFGVGTVNTDPEVIGVFRTSTDTVYKVTNENIKNLFNKTSTTNLSGSGKTYVQGTFYLKKMALNGSDNACITASNHTKIMSFDDFDDIPKKQVYSSGEVCGIKQVMNTYVTNFKNKRTEFSTAFNNLVNAFNSLNENELLMLKNTEIKLNELNNLVKDYDKLYNKAIDNKNIKLLLETQNTEFKLLHKSSEYKMAAAGIASIGALVMLFNYMKK